MRTVGLALGLAVVAGVLALFFPPYLQYVGARIAALIVVTLGLNLLAGNAGLFSLAGTAFMGVGAYGVVTFMTLAQVPLLVAAPVAVAVAWSLGFVLGTVSLRLSGFHLGLVTLGFLLTFQLILRRGGQLTSGYYGAIAPPADLFGLALGPESWAVIAFGLAAAFAVLVQSLVTARPGRAWRTIRHNELAAELFGVKLQHYKTSAFALSAALGAVSGCVYAFLQGAISPPQFGISGAIDQLTYIVVGGLGTVLGSVLGPIVLEFTPELLRALGDKRQLFFAFVLVLMLAVAPTGLAGLVGQLIVRLRDRGLLPRAKPRLEHASVSVAVPDRRPIARRPGGQPVELEFRAVRVVYGGLVALSGLTFKVERGTVHGLIGPNGAGKTTAINAMTGVTGLADGSVLVDGVEICSVRRGLRRDRILGQGIARTFQTPLVVPRLSAVENTMLGLHTSLHAGIVRSALRGPRMQREEAAALAECLDMLARVGFDDDPFVLASALGFAALRRIELARALVAKPSILLLDEPTSGLELHSALDTVRMLRSLQESSPRPLTILLVEHNVPLVFEMCDRVTAMDQGRAIATGEPDDVRRDPLVRSSYLGQSVDHDAELLVPTLPQPTLAEA